MGDTLGAARQLSPGAPLSMRIVIFTDVRSVTTARLVRAALRSTGEHRIVGIVTTQPESFRPSGRALLRRALVALANADVPLRSVLEVECDLFRLGRRHGIPVLVPPAGDPNDPAFLRDGLSPLGAELALSFYCRHRFRAPLLAAFASAVNYHDALLPAYRGVMATSFSIFAGEQVSGFTFHHMTDRLDEGPILLQEALPIEAGDNVEPLTRRKSARAAAVLPRVLELVAAGDPGRPQGDQGSYYSAHDCMALTHLAEPANATRREIQHRIRAFGIVHLTLAGGVHPVTRLRPARAGERLAFRTLDDHLLAPDRFWGLPALFYRLLIEGASRRTS